VDAMENWHTPGAAATGWISAAEGPRFVEIMQELEKLRSKGHEGRDRTQPEGPGRKGKEKAKAA